MNKESKIYIAGHRGLVGSAIQRTLSRHGYSNLIVRTRAELDLLNAEAVEEFFSKENPEYVFLAAARVGGIHANNTYPADFLYENLQIQNHVLQNAWRVQVKKLLFLGSSCIYPRDCPQPIQEIIC
jgi:GDP-L-fucose synthase